MAEMIWEGKSIDSAIDLALQELKCKREEVEIEILQEPVKGIFGITKMAKIKVTSRQSAFLADPIGEKNPSAAVARGKEVLEKI